MNTLDHVSWWLYVCVSEGHIPRSGNAQPQGILTLSWNRYCWSVFVSCCPSLHSYVSIWEFQLLHILTNISIVCVSHVSLSGRCVVVPHCGWTCVPLTANQVQQVSYVLAFWIRSFVKCLFVSLAHVSTVLDLLICSRYDSLLVVCMANVSSPWLVLYLFCSLLLACFDGKKFLGLI